MWWEVTYVGINYNFHDVYVPFGFLEFYQTKTRQTESLKVPDSSPTRILKSNISPKGMNSTFKKIATNVGESWLLILVYNLFVIMQQSW